MTRAEAHNTLLSRCILWGGLMKIAQSKASVFLVVVVLFFSGSATAFEFLENN